MLPTRLDLATLAAAYRAGLKPSTLFAHLHAQAAADTHHAWISLLPEAERTRQPVHLVAHSMGGLVCRAFLQNPDLGDAAARLVH